MKQITLDDRIDAELLSYDGTMAIYVNDFHGHKIERDIDVEYETGSTIKAFILACLYNEAEAGRKSLDDELEYLAEDFINGSGVIRSLGVGLRLKVKDAATLMIIVSDNIATNMIIRYLGIECINEFIKREGFSNTVLHNKLDFDKYDGLGTTTARDYGQFFERLANETLVSAAASRAMLEIFRMQHYNSMLTKDLPQAFLDEDTYDEELISIASKSGSMDASRNDGGLVTTPYGSYIIVLLNKNYYDRVYYPGHPATVYGARISRLIFDQYMALGGRIEP